MPAHVLVPVDDSEMARHALEYACKTHPDGTITVLHVVGEPSLMMGEAVGLSLAEDIEAAAEEHAASVFESAQAVADAHDVEITTETRVGNPARAILAAAEDVDLIVMGAHGGSLADQLVVGNVAERVFRHAPVPVTVVR